MLENGRNGKELGVGSEEWGVSFIKCVQFGLVFCFSLNFIAFLFWSVDFGVWKWGKSI